MRDSLKDMAGKNKEQSPAGEIARRVSEGEREMQRDNGLLLVYNTEPKINETVRGYMPSGA